VTAQLNKLEIWGKAQREAARRRKYECRGRRLLIRQAVDCKDGKMHPTPKSLHGSH